MTNALKIETGTINDGSVNVMVYTAETKYEEYNIKIDTPQEMYKALMLKIRDANQKLLAIKKTIALCRDLQVIDPFKIPQDKLIEFFTRLKQNPTGKTEIRL